MRHIPYNFRAVPHSDSAHQRVAQRHQTECLVLTKLLWTVIVRGVQRRVVEIAHGGDDGAGEDEVG
jgi:hypothetical protein